MDISQLNQEEQAAERMVRLQNVTAALGAALTPEQVIRVIVEEGIRALGGHIGGLGLVSADGTSLETVNYPEITDPRLQPLFRVPIDEAIPLADAVRMGEPIWIENPAQYHALYPDLFESVQSITQTRAGVCLPLIVQGRTIGGLSVTFLQERRFSPADRQFMLTLAQQCALALDRARLFEAEMQARLNAEVEAERSGRLLSVMTALSQTMAFEQVARLIIDEGIKTLGASTGALNLLVDDERFEIIYSIGSRTPEAERGRWLSFPADHDLPVTDAVRRREPIWIETVDGQADRYPAAARLFELYPGAWAILPLIAGDRVLGAMNFAFSESRIFDSADRAFMVSLSYQCAQALERARLYREAEDAATLRERQRIARELHDAVSQTLFSATMVSDALQRIWQRDPQKGLEQLELLQQLTRSAAAEMRILLIELRPETVVTHKLGDLLRQLGYAMQRRTEIEVSMIIRDESKHALPPASQMAFYRIVQESLNNIIKHGQARCARVRLTRCKRQLTLVVIDNGVGFDMQGIEPGAGFSTMWTRADDIGAVLTIKSRVGRGTQVKLIWNLM